MAVRPRVRADLTEVRSELMEVVSALIDAHCRLREIGEDHRKIALHSRPIVENWTRQDAKLYRERTNLERELWRALDHVSAKTKDDALAFGNTELLLAELGDAVETH